MKKERYITPETEAIEVNETDIITTSLTQTYSDEVGNIDKSYFSEDDGLWNLF